MTNYFNDDSFEKELQAASTFRPKANGNRVYQDRMPAIGQVVRFGKSGIFAFDIKKNGKDIKKKEEQLDVVVLNSYFGRKKWDQESEKPRVSCATVKTEVNGEEVLGGLWQIPYADKILNERLNPSGMKIDEETGQLMTCARCFELGQNTDCKQDGVVYVAVVRIMNDEGDMVELATPVFLDISITPTSAINYQQYIVKELNAAGYKRNDVITRLSISERITRFGKVNQLNFQMEDPLSKETKDKVMNLFSEKFNQWKESIARAKEERAAASVNSDDKKNVAKPTNVNTNTRPAAPRKQKEDLPITANLDDIDF